MTEVIGYHAHVYYDSGTRQTADHLRNEIIGGFAIKPGGLSDEPRGPHPIPQFNVMFQTDRFQDIVPWLMLNRRGLDVLVHPLTNDMVDDHTVYALWLGTPVNLKIETLQRRGYRGELLPTAQAKS